MGLMDKFKNLFTEEVEIEEKEETKEPIQKEVIQVEIPSPKKSRSEIYEKKEPKNEEISIEPAKEETKTNEYKFPFFDDNDFDAIDVTPEPKEEKKKTRQKEVYNPPKEEKKVFRPSPIISPVYGILDKGYKKEELSSRENIHSSYYSSKEANVDAIRNKAYGTLESDIETTLFGGNRVLFSDKEDKEETPKKPEPIKEEPAKMQEDSYTFNSSALSDKPRHGSNEEEDLTSLIEEEMEKPVETTKKKKQPRKISDKELFSLIDSMYEKGNKEWLLVSLMYYLFYFTYY